MSVTQVNTIPRKFADVSADVEYTSSGGTTLIDKMTATNISAADVSFDVWLPSSGDAVGNSNHVLKSRAIAPNETYECPEILGQILLDGGFIACQAGSASAIVISSTGRLITTDA